MPKLFMLSLVALLALSTSLYSESQEVTQVVIVNPDGSVLVSVPIALSNEKGEVYAIATPITIRVEGCSNASFYVSSDNVIHIYAPNCSQALVKYLSLDATSKNGSMWVFNITSRYRTIVILPRDAIPTLMSPTPKPTVINDSIGLLFPAGRIVIKYLEIPSEALRQLPQLTTQNRNTVASSNSGVGPSMDVATAIGVSGATLLAIALALKFLRKSRVRREKSPIPRVLDDVDRKIIDALRKYGQQTARELMERTGIPRTTLYRRLAKLRDLGIVEAVTIGGITFYRLGKELGENDA